MDTRELFQRGFSFLRDCFRDAIDRHCEEEIALAVARQKEQDVKSAIAAFLEMKTAETEIMRLLSKFYGVDSIAEATELISAVRTEKRTAELEEYLVSLGMSLVETADYIKTHRVSEQLQSDVKLQNLAIDKLKLYFDKH